MKIRVTSRFDVPFIEALGASAVIGRVNRPKRSGKYRAGFPGLQSRFVRVVEAVAGAARPGSADGLDRLKALPHGRFQQLGAPT